MAKKPLITENDRANIAIAFWEMRDDKAESIRERASVLSKREIGLSTVQRELVGLRKADKDGAYHDPLLDEPWCIGLYHVQSSHLQAIVNLSKQVKPMGKPITVRQIQWIDRLLDLPFNKEHEQVVIGLNMGRLSPDDPRVLALIALWSGALVHVSLMYAEFERGAAIQGIKNDTSEFDDVSLEAIENKLEDYITGLKKQKDAKNG